MWSFQLNLQLPDFAGPQFKVLKVRKPEFCANFELISCSNNEFETLSPFTLDRQTGYFPGEYDRH